MNNFEQVSSDDHQLSEAGEVEVPRSQCIMGPGHTKTPE